MEDIICIMCWTMSLSYQLQFLTHRQENMNFMDMSMIKREWENLLYRNALRIYKGQK